jgi:hypothetical protein
MQWGQSRFLSSGVTQYETGWVTVYVTTDYIKIAIKETALEGEDREQWWAIVNMIINPWVP